MKPFDLERAKAGDTLVHADGRKGRLVAHVPEATANSRVIVLWDGGLVALYTDDGRFTTASPEPVVFMATKIVKHQQWVNLYKSGFLGSGNYATKEEAIKGALSEGLAETRLIEWEVEE